MGGYARIGRPGNFESWPVGWQNLYLQVVFRARWNAADVRTGEGVIRLERGQTYLDLGTVAMIAGWEAAPKSTQSDRLAKFCLAAGFARRRTRQGLVITTSSESGIRDAEAENKGVGAVAAAECEPANSEEKINRTLTGRSPDANRTLTGHETIESAGVSAENRTLTGREPDADRTQTGHCAENRTLVEHETVENEGVTDENRTPTGRGKTLEVREKETKETTPPTPPAGGVEAAAIEGVGDFSTETAEASATGGDGELELGAEAEYLTPRGLAELWNEFTLPAGMLSDGTRGPALMRFVPVDVENMSDSRRRRTERVLKTFPRREMWERILRLVIERGHRGDFDWLVKGNRAERILEGSEFTNIEPGLQQSLALPIDSEGAGAKNRSSPATSPAERAASRYGNQMRAEDWLKSKLKRVGKGA